MDELRISPQDAAKKVAAGDAILLVVVTTAAGRSLSKVPRGALRIPPEEIADRLDELPPTGEVIAFCTCPDDATSARVARMLRARSRTAWALRGAAVGCSS